VLYLENWISLYLQVWYREAVIFNSFDMHSVSVDCLPFESDWLSFIIFLFYTVRLRSFLRETDLIVSNINPIFKKPVAPKKLVTVSSSDCETFSREKNFKIFINFNRLFG